jgi:hypothetical protein
MVHIPHRLRPVLLAIGLGLPATGLLSGAQAIPVNGTQAFLAQSDIAIGGIGLCCDPLPRDTEMISSSSSHVVEKAFLNFFPGPTKPLEFQAQTAARAGIADFAANAKAFDVGFSRADFFSPLGVSGTNGVGSFARIETTLTTFHGGPLSMTFTLPHGFVEYQDSEESPPGAPPMTAFIAANIIVQARDSNGNFVLSSTPCFSSARGSSAMPRRRQPAGSTALPRRARSS